MIGRILDLFIHGSDVPRAIGNDGNVFEGFQESFQVGGQDSGTHQIDLTNPNVIRDVETLRCVTAARIQVHDTFTEG